MTDELEPLTDSYNDVSIDMDDITDETIYLIYRNFISTNMSGATLSRFDEMYATNEDQLTLEEIVSSAVFNEAVIQILEVQLDVDAGPIPPFNV